MLGSALARKIGIEKEREREQDGKYRRPSANIRARLKSEHLGFLQRQELEATAQEFYDLQAKLKEMAIEEEE